MRKEHKLFIGPKPVIGQKHDFSLEEIMECDLCASRERKIIDRQGNILQCTSCGLRFLSPRPRQEDISKIYDWSYENCPGWAEVNPEGQLMHQRRFNFLTRFIQKGNILDVGAGRGEFLSKAKATAKWQCYGTETSRYAVNYAKKEFDISLSFGQLEDLGFPQQFFDAVTLWHTLEHLPSPSRAIKEAWQILKTSGFLFIAVPNDSWLGRRHFFKNAFKKGFNRLPFKKKLKLKKMYPEINEQGNKHLFYFTPRSLSRLLEKYGFRIKRCTVDYSFERFDPKIERRYKFDLLFCRLTGLNLSNAILVTAQKI